MKIILLILGSLLKINVIHCQISNMNCNPELYSKLEVLRGKSLFFVNLDKELSSNGLELKTLFLKEYQKKFPNTIILNFNEEKALYQLEVEGNRSIISELGNTLQSNQKNEQLPQVVWNNDDTPDHLKIIKIINSAKNNNLKVDKIIWENNKEIIIKINSSPKIIIDTETLNSKIDMLGILLTSREIKDYEETIKEIDLRFNLPVLRTTQ